jgi:hypothetical protein
LLLVRVTSVVVSALLLFAEAVAKDSPGMMRFVFFVEDEVLAGEDDLDDEGLSFPLFFLLRHGGGVIVIVVVVIDCPLLFLLCKNSVVESSFCFRSRSSSVLDKTLSGLGRVLDGAVAP